MTTIRANCPTCGEVEMGASSVVLTVEEGDTEGVYSFICPGCDDTVEKRADRKVVMLLLSAGVEVHEVARLDLPLDHPARESGSEAPPFTADDLIDFHFLLERTDWIDELLSADA